MSFFDFFKRTPREEPIPFDKGIGDAIGSTGLRQGNGYIFEEFLLDLQGPKAREKYKEMAYNDSLIWAVLSAMFALLNSADWNVLPSEKDSSGEYQKFFEECLEDMDCTFEEWRGEIFTMFIYGFSMFEMVFKRRIGKNSRYKDGRIGIKCPDPRSQDTIDQWDFADDQTIRGVWQQPYFNIGNRIGRQYIPYDRIVLFRTMSWKRNPEGFSLLRPCYPDYYTKKAIRLIESIWLERDLTGLPTLYMPGELISTDDPLKIKARNTYIKMVRDLKFNEGGGVILPSDCYKNEDGTLTNTALFRFELMSSSGTHAVDTSAIITRYDTSMARTMLADWIMLGNNSKGSHALSDNKTDVYFKAAEGYLKNIAGVINRRVIPMLWRLNGFDDDLMPHVEAGNLAPEDLEGFAQYLTALTGAGLQFAGDPETEKFLRQKLGAPEEVDQASMLQNQKEQIETTQAAMQASKPVQEDKPAQSSTSKSIQDLLKNLDT